MSGLVESNGIQVETGRCVPDLEGLAGIEDDIAAEGGAGPAERRRDRHFVIVVNRLSRDADVAETGIALHSTERAERLAAVGRHADIHIDLGQPRLECPQDLPLPSSRRRHLVESPEQDAGAVGGWRPVWDEAEREMAGVGPRNTERGRHVAGLQQFETRTESKGARALHGRGLARAFRDRRTLGGMPGRASWSNGSNP